jgi:RimJ/RimL family protein N-acetyltransferase
MPLSEPPVLETQRLRVRAFRESDLDDIEAIHRDEETTFHLPCGTWCTADDRKAWHDRVRVLLTAGTGVQFVLEERTTGGVIGACVVFRLEEGSARAEIGYVLGRSHWGRGLMREALEAVVSHAFGPWGLRRLEAEVDPDNLRSDRVVRSLGFVEEGRLRQRWTAKGRTYDTRIFGLLREDWKARG